MATFTPEHQLVALALTRPALMEILAKKTPGKDPLYTTNVLTDMIIQVKKLPNYSENKLLELQQEPASEITTAIINAINAQVPISNITASINSAISSATSSALALTSVPIYPQVSKQKTNATQTFTPEKMQQLFTKINELSEILKNH